MPKSLRTAATALLATAGTFATASLVAATPADAASHRKPVYLHTTSKNLVVGASKVRPGVVEIHNSGKHAIVLPTKKHAGVDTLVKDLKKSSSKRFFADFAFRGIVEAHHSIYLRLHRGALYTLDAQRKHYPAESVHVMDIAGKTWNASLPKSEAITISGHNKLTVPGKAPRKAFFHVVNNSGKMQAISLMRISSRTPAADIKAAMADPTPETLGKLDMIGFDDLGELGPHQTFWTQVRNPAGYTVVLTDSFPNNSNSLFQKGTMGTIHVN